MAAGFSNRINGNTGAQAANLGMRGLGGMDLSALISSSFRGEQPIQALAARALAASALGATSLGQGMGGGGQMNLGGVLGPGGQLSGLSNSMGLMQGSVGYNGAGSLLQQQGAIVPIDLVKALLKTLCCAPLDSGNASSYGAYSDVASQVQMLQAHVQQQVELCVCVATCRLSL